MKKLTTLILGLSAVVLMQAQERKKFIDNEMIDGFRRNAESVFDMRFLEQDMLDVALDRNLVEQYDTVCTYRVSHNAVTDQKKSGRCWYFSTLNILSTLQNRVSSSFFISYLSNHSKETCLQIP